MCNLNPRSIYNKVDEFSTFVEQQELDLICLSESWERQDMSLDNVINIENYKVISNVSQRKATGGRPAIIVNTQKFQVKDLTNTVVQIPWGIEAVWAVLTPINASSKSRIKKIAVCSFYYRTKTKKKTLLLDHFSDAYHILSKKYSENLHFIIAGDANHLKLDQVLNLSSNFKQIVQDWTRYNPPGFA